ncbi:MAG: SUMF1/EgtB/PvdO family nonheme iron enzyme [Pontiellaceae bacterium]|nr:SUMF1/EgtB/PvdO family nonheme iron enzyme [Pontiellaceae bacterium]
MKKKSGNDLVDLEKRLRKRRSHGRKIILFGFPLFLLLGGGITLRVMYSHARSIIDVFPGSVRGGLIDLFAPSSMLPERLTGLDSIGETMEMMAQYAEPIEEENGIEEELQNARQATYTKLEEIVSRRLLDREYSSVVSFSVDDLFPEYFATVDVFADAPDEQLIEYCRLFWGRYIVQILNKYQADKNNENGGKWLAWANGAYIWGLWDYARLTNEEDIRKVQEELNASIIKCAIKFWESNGGNSIVVNNYFPILAGRFFGALENRDGAGFLWWSKYAGIPGKERDSYGALYLPAQTQFSLAGEDKSEFLIRFSLVPLNLGYDGNENIFPEYTNSEFLSPVYLAVGEVTEGQMNVFRQRNGKGGASLGGSTPCVDCTVDEAVEFCNWLSEIDGLKPLYRRTEQGWVVNMSQVGYRLPFAYEWEYAARFGYDFFRKSEASSWKDIQSRLERDGDFIGNELVNYYWKDSPRTLEENNFPYPLGVFDLCGNASEIVMLTEKPVSTERGEIPVSFSVMKGGVDGTGARLATLAPWLLDGENEKPLRTIDHLLNDKNGFRVLRSVPIRSLYQ